MPFQSEKQRKYLWANEPAIAREWTDKYGSRVKKANGGIGDLIQKYNPFTGVGAGLYGHFQNLGDIKANAPNQRDYNIEATRDFWSNLSNNIQNPVTRGIMDVTSPALSLVTSPIYDAMQAGIRTVYDTNTGEFRGPLDNFDITNTMNPDYKGNPTPGFFTRLDQENPISSAWERYLGASKHLSEKYPNASNSLAKAWNAIKNEFGGSAQAAGIPIKKITQDEEEPYDFTERLMRRGDFRPSSSYPSYNAWQMRAAQAPGLKRNIGRVMDFLRGPGTRLTPAQQRANQNYMTQQRITRNPQTGRMQGGLFAGQNAPGTSFFGSKTFQEMANKQIAKYGKTAPKAKVDAWKGVVTSGRDPGTGTSYTGHGKSGMGRSADRFAAEGGLMTLWQR